MIKKLLFTALTVVGLNAVSQNFSAMYHFTGVMSGTANTGTVDPTPTPTANGVTFGSFMAFGTPSTVSAAGVFAFNNWGTGATNGDNVTFTGSLNPSQYYEVTVTPDNNSTVTINTISFHMSRSSTGPRHWSVRGNSDSYAANLTASISPSNSNIAVVSGDRFFWSLDSYTVSGGKQEAGNLVIPGAAYANKTTPMTFRFYAWNAETTNGTFRIDTVVFNGSATLISGLQSYSHDLNAAFKLYPNPSKDGAVCIESKGNATRVEVINILGAVVASQNGIASDKLKLDLSGLPSGTYFVRLFSGKSVHTEKLIITE